jgi:hypothetical protein
MWSSQFGHIGMSFVFQFVECNAKSVFLFLGLISYPNLLEIEKVLLPEASLDKWVIISAEDNGMDARHTYCLLN